MVKKSHPPKNVPAFRWVRLKPLKYKRHSAVAKVLKNGRVLVQGGTYEVFLPKNRDVFPPAEVWDPKTGAWSGGRDLAKAVGVQKSRTDWSSKKAYGRTSPTLTPLPDGRILVTGGKEPGYSVGPYEEDPDPYDTAFIVDPRTGRRTPAGKLCKARWKHTVALFPDGSVMLIGGANNFGHAINDVELGLPPDFSKSPIHRAQAEQYREQIADQDCKALLKKASEARRQKHFKKALRLVRRALDVAPGNREAWEDLGFTYTALGRHEEALAEYRRALEKNPKSAFLWFYSAHALITLKREKEALAAYDKVIKLVDKEGKDFTTDAIYEQARKQRQYLALKLKGADAALKATGGNDAELTTEEWNNKGTALMQQNKAADALKCYDQALRLDPKNDFAWFNRGTALLALKWPTEARNAFEKCILLRGDGGMTALLNHGVACYDMGDFNASVKSYDRLLELKPSQQQAVLAWYNRGNSFQAMKRYDRAVESQDQALALNPGYENAWYNKACAHAHLGQFEKAHEAVKKFLKLAPGRRDELARDRELENYWAWEKNQ